MTPFMLRIAELVGTEPDGLTEADLARSSRGQDPPGGGVRDTQGRAPMSGSVERTR